MGGTAGQYEARSRLFAGEAAVLELETVGITKATTPLLREHFAQLLAITKVLLSHLIVSITSSMALSCKKG